MIQESDLTILLASARLSAVDFDRFLRERERQFLETKEPEFVQVVRELVSREESVLTEMVKYKLRRRPTEWVQLLQETSDVRVGLRHLGILSKAAHASEDKIQSVAGVSGIGEWVEFLVYAETEVIYRILNRLQRGLGRTVNQAKKLANVAMLDQAKNLRTPVNTRFKDFETIRGEMAHNVNFAQAGHVEHYRIWEVVSLGEYPGEPEEIISRTIESRVDNFRHVIRVEAAQVARLLQELYPEWRVLLNTVFPL